MAHKALEIILRWPLGVILVILALTAPASWLVYNAEFAPSIVESFVNDPADYRKAIELESLFPGNPDSLVWIATNEDEDLATADTFRKIRAAAREVEQLAVVKRVIALPDISRSQSLVSGIRGTTAKIVLNAKLKQGQVPKATGRTNPILPAYGDVTDSELQLRIDQALADQGVAASLVSENQQSHVMIAELNQALDMQPTDQVAFIQSIETIVRANGLGEGGYYCSGLIPLQAYAFAEIDNVLYRILPVGGLLICLAVMWVFRRVEVVLVTAAIAAVSITWGIAIGIALFGKFSVLMAAVPLMVLVISTADVIHLISSYTAECEKGKSHETAVRKSFIEVGGACILTSITTFLGFASLEFVPSKTIRQFGISAAAGVASALLLTIVVVPIFLDWLHRRQRPVTSAARASAWTQWMGARCLEWGLFHPKLTIMCSLALLIICGLWTGKLSLDPDLTQRFSSDHAITMSTVFFQEQFGGVNSAEILLHGSSDELLSPTNVQKMKQFTSICTDRLNCSSANSVADVLTTFLSQVDYKNPEGLPESVVHAKAAIAYLHQIEPELVSSLVSEEGDYVRILVRIPETSYLAMTRMTEQLVAEAEDIFGDNIEISDKGSAPLVGRAVREIIRGHLQGFAFCFTTIFFLIAFGLRSFRLAWISVLPNLTPLMVLGGMVAYFHQVADSDLLAVGTLGLGLAVDDTIHFLSRYKIERQSKASVREALQSTMDHTGLAIIRTTIILSVGFVPFAFAEYWSINMLGTYLVVVLFAAVLADLIVLPAIVVLVEKWIKSRKRATGNAENSTVAQKVAN